MTTRRQFLKTTGAAMASLPFITHQSFFDEKVPVYAHLWVYASRYPPNWDCTPMLDEVFSDLAYAGYNGVEIMEPILRHDDAVQRLLDLQGKHKIALAGTSYSGNMWKKDERNKIAEDIELVTGRLNKAGGKMIGISVGSAGRKKTEEELDAQAVLLNDILRICAKNNIEANIHNHTYEMEHDMYDFEGTITRVPDLRLGPDLNWLVRSKIDPVWFIKTYGHKMVYMHIRDQKADGKWSEAVGEGAMDFKGISSALKDVKYDRNAAVELAFEGGFKPTRPLKESWKKSRQYVHSVFGW
jgi:sugar phosphate isomerase/epimerase